MKPVVPEFDEEPGFSPPPNSRGGYPPPSGPDGEPVAASTSEHLPSFPPVIPPQIDLSLADEENWVPPEGVTIACMTCKHFWHTKSVAVSWSTRAPDKRRKTGRAYCTQFIDPLPLLGAYITDCNRKQEKDQ
jgi:hypothetical protein